MSPGKENDDSGIIVLLDWSLLLVLHQSPHQSYGVCWVVVLFRWGVSTVPWIMCWSTTGFVVGTLTPWLEWEISPESVFTNVWHSRKSFKSRVICRDLPQPLWEVSTLKTPLVGIQTHRDSTDVLRHIIKNVSSRLVCTIQSPVMSRIWNFFSTPET